MKVDLFKHIIAVVTDCEALYEDIVIDFKASGYCVVHMLYPYTRETLMHNAYKLWNNVNMLVVADDWEMHSHTRYMVRTAYEFGIPVYRFLDSTVVEDGGLSIEPISEHELLTVIGMNAEMVDIER